MPRKPSYVRPAPTLVDRWARLLANDEETVPAIPPTTAPESIATSEAQATTETQDAARAGQSGFFPRRDATPISLENLVRDRTAGT